MKKIGRWLLIQILLIAVFLALGLTLLEGIRSLAGGNEPRTSLTANLLARWRHRSPGAILTRTGKGDKLNEKVLAHYADHFLGDERQLQELLPEITAAH